jgi:AraC-like DNA-binding protein
MSSPRLTVHRHGVVHWGSRERIAAHASPPWKLIVGVDAEVTIASDAGVLRARSIVVAPHVPHAIDAPGCAVTFLAEPGIAGVPLRGLDAAVVALEGRLAERVQAAARAFPAEPADDALHHAAVLRELHLASGSRVDPRVAEVLHGVASDPDYPIEPILARRRISASRLRHLVRADTGVGLRSHRLWHRTMLAVESLLAGATIAGAAAEAGFADHAHFTRTFARFIGRTPSSIHGRTTLADTYAERR